MLEMESALCRYQGGLVSFEGHALSVRVMSLVWDRFPGSGSALLTLLALADFANDQGGSIHPAILTIAAKVRLSKSQAKRVVHNLIADGWISVVGNYTGGAPGSTRQYQINLEKLNETGSVHAPPTGCAHEPPTIERGCTHAPEGVHPCAQTGCTHEPQPTNEPSITVTSSSSGDEVKTSKEIYTTKRKRKISGWKLKAFNRFWDVFSYKTGKAETADAWLDIPGLTVDLVNNEILPAATDEAKRRPQLRENDHTPKMAQGWLSGRRWEDELPGSKKSNGVPERSEDEWQAVARKLGMEKWKPGQPWLPWQSMIYAKEQAGGDEA